MYASMFVYIKLIIHYIYIPISCFDFDYLPLYSESDTTALNETR